MEVIAPRTRTMDTLNLTYPVRRFPYMPMRQMEYIAEATMKNAPLSTLATLPPYLASAYMSIISSDVQLIHTHLAIPLGFLASLNPRKTPQLITCHGSDISYPMEKPIYRAFTGYALRKADRIVAVSDYVKQLILQMGADPSKTETIYLGVDVERFKPDNKGNELTIGTLGRLVPEKKIEDLLYATKEIDGKIDFKLRIGGDGPDQARLMKIAEMLELDVDFTGRVQDTVSFHRSLDIFVLASSREGLSVSLQEAMACGAVPVAVDAHGCREIIKDQINGYLFDPSNRVVLAERILEAVNNKEIAKKAQKTIIERFNSETAAKKYLELYRDMGIFF